MKLSRAVAQTKSAGTLPFGCNSAGNSDDNKFSASSPAATPSSRCTYSYTTEYTPGRSSEMLRVLPKVTFSPATFCSLDRDVFGHVPEPGTFALAHAAFETAGLAVRATVFVQPWQGFHQAIDERWSELAGRPVFQFAQGRVPSRITGKMGVKRRALIDGAVGNTCMVVLPGLDCDSDLGL